MQEPTTPATSNGMFGDIRVELQACPTLMSMVVYLIGMMRALAVALLHEELDRRGREPEEWPNCPHCGKKLRSKGFRERQLVVLFGRIRWARRIGRCANGCNGSQIAPLDERLELQANQRTSAELKRFACMLCVFMPYQTTVVLLQHLLGVKLSADAVWNWCQVAGQQIGQQLEDDLEAWAAKKLPTPEPLPADLADAPLALGADGVMVPLRRDGGSPKGAIVWREVKVGIITRMRNGMNTKGEKVRKLVQRRVVALLGTIDAFRPILQWEAMRQRVHEAGHVVWVSDGGNGYWRLFESLVKKAATKSVVGILDFYHAVQHLSVVGKACFDGRTKTFQNWFVMIRHKLRHGGEQDVINELDRLRISECISKQGRDVANTAYYYFKEHEDAIHYQTFHADALPLGSGFVESTCKWLIQQRFKGTGMRWSEDGLNALLGVRIAWVNHRFDDLFPLAKGSPS